MKWDYMMDTMNTPTTMRDGKKKTLHPAERRRIAKVKHLLYVNYKKEVPARECVFSCR